MNTITLKLPITKATVHIKHIELLQNDSLNINYVYDKNNHSEKEISEELGNYIVKALEEVIN